MIPGLVIEERHGQLHVSGFTLRALCDPFADEPWEYPDAEIVSSAAALAGPVTLDFFGAVGCGVESVTASLHITPDAARGGAPSRAVKLAYVVQLGRMYTRKGHESWDGEKNVIMQRRPDDAE